MKVAALSPNALTLPSRPSVESQIVGGRQKVVRHGIFFCVIAKHRRSCYRQLNGETILADECKCVVNWRRSGIEVSRKLDCPIDEHKVVALREVQE